MKIYKCVIIEDDVKEQQILLSYLQKLNYLEITNIFSNPIEAIPILQSGDTEILFTGIELPEISGMELIKVLVNPPKIILLTTQSNYAVEAFEFGVTDYLIKPYTFERLLKAVSRAIDKNDLPTKTKETESTIFLKSGRDSLKFRVSNIQYIEALGSFTKVYTSEKVSTISESISTLQDKLSNDFIRVHKSYLVSKQKVSGISAKNVMIEDKKIPLGVSYREFVEKSINSD